MKLTRYDEHILQYDDVCTDDDSNNITNTTTPPITDISSLRLPNNITLSSPAPIISNTPQPQASVSSSNSITPSSSVSPSSSV